MTQQEAFGIAAFSSRQQVMRFDSALRRKGLRSQIISTPRDVALGCGLSVRFDLNDAPAVMETYRQSRPGSLIGFYRVARQPDGRTRVTAM
ncbi:MAG: DUF3343 domain-containing protein [Clostridiales bacterium]|nr:DUF3343 domain-containing protein [Clostridiales bacterium]